MGCAGHDGEPVRATEMGGRHPIELENLAIRPAHDEQGGAAYERKPSVSEVGATPRDTTARTVLSGDPAAHNAAAAPVLAPK